MEDRHPVGDRHRGHVGDGNRERDRLIAEHMPGLRRYARALANTQDEANDLVQESVTKALTHWDSLHQRASVKSWLFSILRYHFLETVRSQKRWRTILSEVPLEEAALTQGTVPPTQEVSVQLSQVDRALAQLPDEQREILVLVAVEGLSYADAAAVLAVPVGTVMSRLSRARARLRLETDGGMP